MVRRVVMNEEAPKDIAVDLGVSAAAVGMAKCRFLTRVRQKYKDLEEREEL